MQYCAPSDSSMASMKSRSGLGPDEATFHATVRPVPLGNTATNPSRSASSLQPLLLEWNSAPSDNP